MITWSYERVIKHENPFFGGGQDQNVAGLDLLVDGGDSFAQPGSTRRFGVAAPVFEETLVGSRLEVEEFLDGAGLGVGTGEQIPGSEFVLAEILFDSKGLDLHAKESGKRTGVASRANLTRPGCGSVRRPPSRCKLAGWQGMIRGLKSPTRPGVQRALPWLTALPSASRKNFKS